MRKIMTVLLLLLVMALVGCGSEEESKQAEPQTQNEGTFTFEEADFNMELVDTEGNLINIAPAGKTIYAYFTGKG